MADRTLVVETSSGAARGFLDRGVPNWRGVPYGVVEQRFRPPAAVEPLGMIDASRWGPVSWQVPMSPGPQRWSALYPDAVKHENCLNLNIWSARPDRTDLQPVLVWLHPGRHMVGGNMPTVDPWALAARHELVVVTCNYRLGPWGWLHLGTLDAGFDECSNLAVRDQLLALRWVQDNIAGFGGNPDNVTLFGLSTGASDVATLLGIPSARGLFHRAAVYSGHAEHEIDLAEAAGFAQRFVAAAGSLSSQPAGLAGISNMELRHVHRQVLKAGAVRYEPVTDGELIPQPTLHAIKSGLSADVPLLVSVTSDEARILDLVPGRAVNEKYAALFGDGGSAKHDEKIAALSQKLYFEPAERLLSAANSARGRCWAQVFDYHPTTWHLAGNPVVAGKPVHAADTAALFGDADGSAGTKLDRAICAEEQRALVDFARIGKPPWQEYTLDDPVAKWIGPVGSAEPLLRPLPGAA